MPQQLAGLLPMILMFAVFYLFLIRPQQKQRKERQEMLNSLKKGDKVVTIGGIHGTLTSVKENQVRLKVADNLELKLNREAIGYVLREAKAKKVEETDPGEPEVKDQTSEAEDKMGTTEEQA